VYITCFIFSGEFLLRLRQLEKSLLSSLNEVKGRILDDDSIITHLETLKKEAEEIARRFEETDLTMAEVESTSQQYIPLAQACSSIYFTLESLNQVNEKCIQMHYYFDFIFLAIHQLICRVC
jgi:dynein heavy chain 1, cytosolic